MKLGPVAACSALMLPPQAWSRLDGPVMVWWRCAAGRRDWRFG